MNKKRYLFATLMLSLLSINKAYAICTQEELDEFKKVEDKYYASYQINKETKSFDIILNNPPSEKYVYSISDGFHENLDVLNIYFDNESVIYKDIKKGEYKILVIGKTKECNDVLKTLTITIPRYNEYYGDPLCEGIEEFILCQETYDKEIDRETFESRVNTYKKTKLKKEQEENENDKPKENEIITYIKSNLIQIIIITIFLILVTITIIVTINSARKSRRLE